MKRSLFALTRWIQFIVYGQIGKTKNHFTWVVHHLKFIQNKNSKKSIWETTMTPSSSLLLLLPLDCTRTNSFECLLPTFVIWNGWNVTFLRHSFTSSYLSLRVRWLLRLRLAAVCNRFDPWRLAKEEKTQFPFFNDFICSSFPAKLNDFIVVRAMFYSYQILPWLLCRCSRRKIWIKIWINELETVCMCIVRAHVDSLFTWRSVLTWNPFCSSTPTRCILNAHAHTRPVERCNKWIKI